MVCFDKKFLLYILMYGVPIVVKKIDQNLRQNFFTKVYRIICSLCRNGFCILCFFILMIFHFLQNLLMLTSPKLDFPFYDFF
jgi:hypothetical protein